MPVEKSRDLRDLVTESLRAKGVLGKVQAEIRASVFLALEEHDAFKDRNPFLNNKLKEFLTTNEGLVVFSLVRELLEFFSLEFTCMVLDPETHTGVDVNYLDKNKLAKELSLENSGDQPLLGQLVHLLRQKNVPSEKSDSPKDFPLPINGLNGSTDPVSNQDKLEKVFSGLKERVLSDLPPLNHVKVEDKASVRENKLIDLSIDDSIITKEGSESEVEEDISNEAQSEQQDENTVDLSISKSSGHGDYQEDIK